MKISHGELETCRSNPKVWISGQQSGGGYRRFSYNRALSFAICEFHRANSISAANDKLDGYVKKNFKDLKRITKLYDSLNEYARWFVSSGIISADANVRLEYPYDGDWQLGGLVSRVDFLTSCYRAILFGAIPLAWKEELRMPLIQIAVGERYGRPASEVRVGFQDLSQNLLVDTRYSESVRNNALAQFESVGAKVFKLWPWASAKI
jgi:hypothetical protein